MTRGGAPFELKSAQFRREREATWRELEDLLAKVDRVGLHGLAVDELHRLPVLYRATVSSLSVARAISLDRNLLDYLTNLTCRAYVAVYAVKRRPWRTVVGFVTRDLPRAVRAHGLHLGAAIACLGLGVLIGWALTLADLDRYHTFVPAAMAQGRVPSATTEQLREPLYASDEGALELFATFLFTHNSKVGILCFSLGFAAAIPVVFLLVHNGLMLGAMAALYQSRSLGTEFWAWVMPHGVTELLAVALCGAAGFAFAGAVLFPGKRSRLDNLMVRGREIGQIVLGAVVLFLIAAAIEGFFRQQVHAEAVRGALAAVTAMLWAAYFGLAGRGAGR